MKLQGAVLWYYIAGTCIVEGEDEGAWRNVSVLHRMAVATAPRNGPG
jgi:hypothetical protein